MKKLRLLVTEKCNRFCVGCCNKDWDLSTLPQWDYISEDYQEIMLTGGEPMLFPNLVESIITVIKHRQKIIDYLPVEPKIYLYTAFPKNIFKVLHLLDGITLTLHDQLDVNPFIQFQDRLDGFVNQAFPDGFSFRLNIFKGIDVPIIRDYWKVKDHMYWVKDAPLPHNEVFMKA